ncbi:MAG TPA: trypsin-like serine protease [Pseudobdellovibrionaceae bacterium]
MKKRILIPLFFFNLFFYSISGFAVVQGVELIENENLPSPFVSLNFGLKGLAPDPCSATYLGNGKILTAAHCFLLNEYAKIDPEICIQDYTNLQKLCVHKADYEVYFPPLEEQGYKAPTRKTHSVIRLPKPDLAVIVLKEGLRSKLPNLEVVHLISPSALSLELNQKKFKLVGQGCADYIIPPGEIPKGVGVFRMADVLLNPLDSTLELNSIWTDRQGNGGVCWGDSGGALMLVAEESPLKLTQIAVVSAMKTKYDPATGKPHLVTSIYTRLDRQEIQNWLQNTILVLP